MFENYSLYFSGTIILSVNADYVTVLYATVRTATSSWPYDYDQEVNNRPTIMADKRSVW
jgi:hypothetical protein